MCIHRTTSTISNMLIANEKELDNYLSDAILTPKVFGITLIRKQTVSFIQII